MPASFEFLIAITASPSSASSSSPAWGFLDWWSFLGTLGTLIGLIFALIGLYVAIKQIAKTLNATKASVITAVEMSRQQLGILLGRLTETQSRIEQSVQLGNRDELLTLIDAWMRMASELTGFIEQFELPIAKQGTDEIMSQLGLMKGSSIRRDPYQRLQTVLVGSISSAKITRHNIEQMQSKVKLATPTIAWRSSVRDVVLEGAQFQGQMSNYIREGRLGGN